MTVAEAEVVWLIYLVMGIVVILCLTLFMAILLIRRATKKTRAYTEELNEQIAEMEAETAAMKAETAAMKVERAAMKARRIRGEELDERIREMIVADKEHSSRSDIIERKKDHG